MTKRSIIIGMGIGQLYKTVLENLKYSIITVDQDSGKNADFTSVESAIEDGCVFDTAHICTPNFTHEELARKLAPVSKIIFIEKPGVTDSAAWISLVSDFPKTRFIMVKNNMWRNNIIELKALADQAKIVNIRWIRRNCIPSPGSWFTNKQLAFGGVSRDLMPHLLSLYVAMNSKWASEDVIDQGAVTRWKLEQIESTDYGTINPAGVYDVDDNCHISFGNKWRLEADWRSMDKEDSSIEFVMHDDSVERFELGWCPEDAYQSMIKEAVEQIEDDDYWIDQSNIDCWIHERVENL